MQWIKRISLFLVLNFLIMITISTVLRIFNIQPYLTQSGLNIQALAIFCLIWGMGGSIISLLLSKMMAKWTMGVQVINENSSDPILRSLYDSVKRLSKKAGLPMPEVGIFHSNQLNAFATGPSRSRSLVAVSTGLLKGMEWNEIEGVIGHELAHVANGDMVTMTLLQGVVNAFVLFLARIAAYIVLRGSDREERGGSSYFSYYLASMFFEIVFMLIGSLLVCWFSRKREYRADLGGGLLAGKENMIAALERLQGAYAKLPEKQEQSSIAALQISSKLSWLQLYSTHPPLENRIATLKKAHI